jgi:hypothetical protein
VSNNRRIVTPDEVSRQLNTAIPGYDPSRKVTRGDLDQLVADFQNILDTIQENSRIQAIRIEALIKFTAQRLAALADGVPPSSVGYSANRTKGIVGAYWDFVAKMGNVQIPVLANMVHFDKTIAARIEVARKWNVKHPDMPLYCDDLHLEELVEEQSHVVTKEEQELIDQFLATEHFRKMWALMLENLAKKNQLSDEKCGIHTFVSRSECGCG